MPLSIEVVAELLATYATDPPAPFSAIARMLCDLLARVRAIDVALDTNPQIQRIGGRLALIVDVAALVG